MIVSRTSRTKSSIESLKLRLNDDKPAMAPQSGIDLGAGQSNLPHEMA